MREGVLSARSSPRRERQRGAVGGEGESRPYESIRLGLALDRLETGGASGADPAPVEQSCDQRRPGEREQGKSACEVDDQREGDGEGAEQVRRGERPRALTMTQPGHRDQ